ncbi:excitatory amino acid transporter 1-like isoform X3 [Octopus bimaculoides]|uniref:excitatory amino acid transporter 1-like isoform X3 n=1 Tax=Octopus bimaculoides TaxID=37653 RepID=UPI0022E35465|nr:excitatory amino acid transporter 1-like isoform X3 [Octopus bimaculoides]
MLDYCRNDRTAMDRCSRRVAFIKFLKENSLLLLTLVSVIASFILGFVIRSAQPSNDAIIWIGMPGEIFLRTLTAMITPLIISNVIAGTRRDINQDNPGRVKVVIYAEDLFADLIRNIFPDNIIGASFRQTLTSYKKVEAQLNMSEEFANNTIYQRHIGYSDGSNILGLITFSFLFGMVAGSLKEKGEPFHMFFESTSLITAEIFKYLFKITPIGVASLIMASIAGIKDINTLFTSLGMFSLTVFTGLACHMLVFINLIYLIIFRKNPFKFLFTCIRPYILAFTFTSSSAAFPEMESSLVERNGADKRVIGVSLPLVVTLNAGGSALFIVTAALFLANYQGVDLNAGNMIVLVVLTAIVTMALPGVPSSSIVTLILLLTSMNINPKPVAMLYALEWLLDRLRSGNNVLSHILGCLIIDHFLKPSSSKDKKKYKIEENCEELKTMTSTVTPSSSEEEKISLFTNGTNPVISQT